MADFFKDMSMADAEHLEGLSRVMFELRSSRDQLYKQYEVADAGALLEKIQTGTIAEHPAYDHYLSIKILEEMRLAVREELKDFLPRVNRT